MNTIENTIKPHRRYRQKDIMAIQGECVAGNLGRAHRIVARLYENAFRDVGLSAPQFSLLISLAISPGSSARDLSQILGSDPSTVSRNTELLSSRGLLRVEAGEDRRVRRYSLSELGEETVQRCIPRWRAAQRTALKHIGRSYWRCMRRSLRRLPE